MTYGTQVRGRQLHEVLEALRYLIQARWRVEELAERMGVGRRTAHRLVEAIEAAGVPVQAEYEGRYSYRWVEREDAEKALGLR